VYIDGEVRAPGVQVLNDVPMNLYEAINRAGGFSPTADQSRLMLVRNGESFRINLPKILQEGYNPARLVLRQGDLLRVLSREDSGVFVMGEVNKPTVAVPLRDGRLTLSDALAQAGSLNTSSSDPSQVYVIRGSADKNFKVFHLDAK
ncbi:SLBB domain-containing protein, partial [Klebsiella pneumoniae]|nr:SLBB domain-containing protein [Klebsiella pneumoniae]